MFKRWRPPKPRKVIHTEKSIQIVNKPYVDQSLWQTLLSTIDLNLSCARDYDDIIVVSLPYSIEEISKALSEILNKLHLICMLPLIMEYLFKYGNNIESKLHMTKIHDAMKTMSIIIIDIQTLEIIYIPRLVTDLLVANSCTNKHFTKIQPMCWTATWSFHSTNLTTKTSINFQNIMNDICQQFEKNENIMNNFIVYEGNPMRQQERIKNVERRATLAQKKIKHCVDLAKQKAKDKDKKGALIELKKKKLWEKKLDIFKTTLKTLKLEQKEIKELTLDPSPMYEFVNLLSEDMIISPILKADTLL
eukprot:164467_1